MGAVKTAMSGQRMGMGMLMQLHIKLLNKVSQFSWHISCQPTDKAQHQLLGLEDHQQIQ